MNRILSKREYRSAQNVRSSDDPNLPTPKDASLSLVNVYEVEQRKCAGKNGRGLCFNVERFNLVV